MVVVDGGGRLRLRGGAELLSCRPSRDDLPFCGI